MKQKKAKNIGLYIVLAVVGLIALMLMYKTCTYPKPLVPTGKTDTVYHEIYVFPNAERIPEVIYVPSTEIIRYKQPLNIDTSFRYRTDSNWVVIYKPGYWDSTVYHFDTVAGYNKAFFEHAVHNPKLLKLRSGATGMDFEFLYPNGEPVTKKYKTQAGWEYTWVNDSLYAKPISQFKIPKFPVRTSANLYLGLHPIRMLPELAIDGAIQYKNFGLYGRAGVNPAAIDLQTGFKFQLK
jgi:hypothetical protein